MQAALIFLIVLASPSYPGTNPRPLTVDAGSTFAYIDSLSFEDTDADGLTDLVEAVLALDPINSDTDGDGMGDGWEVWNNLDPLDADDAFDDMDGDGLENATEYQFGTLIFELDTDGDDFWDVIEFERGTDPLSPASYPYTDIFGDLNADRVVDAVDVQFVINGALDCLTPVPTNINKTGGVNALDIQTVINAALNFQG